jgi:type I restriction enzyme M protein
MENIEQIERRLWEAADQLRANSKLTSTEYYMPVLGLIFLRHAFNRFLVVKEDVEKNLPKRGGVPRPIKKDDFVQKSALFLREKSRFDYLLNLPADKDRGQAINGAMDAIEEDYEGLKGVLPKDYQIFESDVLGRLLKIFNDEALQKASGDVFGRIYEYFLMKFAMGGAQDMGEFFTPISLVQTIVNVIKPDHGTVFDPACGSGGMFVQTSHFLEEAGKEMPKGVTFFGQEKTGDHDFLWNEKTGLPLQAYSPEDVKTKAEMVFSHIFMQYPTASPSIYATALGCLWLSFRPTNFPASHMIARKE